MKNAKALREAKASATVTQADRDYVRKLGDEMYSRDVGPYLAAELREAKELLKEATERLKAEQEALAGMIRAREEVEEYMREKAQEKARKPHDWAWGITEIALYAAQLRAENEELKRRLAATQAAKAQEMK